MHDPVADMLTRIRNAQQAKHMSVIISFSKLKEEIAKVLKEEGYIKDYAIVSLQDNSAPKTNKSPSPFKGIRLELKYYHNKPVIERILRISRPGIRIYKSAKELAPIPGFGIAILSTSQGVMTHSAAKKQNLGGEVLCEVA